jgi:hypothetical protein
LQKQREGVSGGAVQRGMEEDAAEEQDLCEWEGSYRLALHNSTKLNSQYPSYVMAHPLPSSSSLCIFMEITL